MDSADSVGSKRIKVYKLLFGLPLLLLPISAAIVVCGQLMKVAREKQAVAAYSKELQDLQSKGLLWDSTKLATDYELNTQTDHGRWSKICSELHWLAVEGEAAGVPYFDRNTPTDEVEVLNSSKSWSNAKACIEFTSSCNDLLTKIRNSVASEKPYPFEFRINYSLTDFSGVTELRCQRALKRGQLGALSKGASSTRRLSVIFMGSTLLLSLEMHRWRIGWQWIKHRELCNFSLRA